MMAKKAQLFGDEYALGKIMAISDPREQKAIGRSVKGFVDWKWNAVSRDVVFRGNMAKFTQNYGYVRVCLVQPTECSTLSQKSTSLN